MSGLRVVGEASALRCEGVRGVWRMCWLEPWLRALVHGVVDCRIGFGKR